jgi:hypothetical protein
LRLWGEGAVTEGTGEGAVKVDLEVWGASNLRGGAVFTAKRGECAVEDAEVRREA